MTENKKIRNTFSKSERLCLKNRIDVLFKKGISKRAGCIRMIYHRSDEELEAPVQVLFSVPKKKLHKAVKRNLIRRRMSEAYRRNKHSITGHYAEGGKYLSIAFLYNGTEIMDFHEIEGNIKQLIGKIPAP